MVMYPWPPPLVGSTRVNLLFCPSQKADLASQFGFCPSRSRFGPSRFAFALAEKPNNLLFGTNSFGIFYFCIPPMPILEPISTPPMSQKVEFSFFAFALSQGPKPKSRIWFCFLLRGTWEPKRQISRIAESLVSWACWLCFFAFCSMGAEKANKPNSRTVGFMVIWLCFFAFLFRRSQKANKPNSRIIGFMVIGLCFLAFLGHGSR